MHGAGLWVAAAAPKAACTRVRAWSAWAVQEIVVIIIIVIRVVLVD